MRARRVVMSGFSVAIVALALSGCGASPPLPAAAITSPYVSNTSAVVDPLSGIGNQRARVRVCSLTGGPLTVDVHSPGASAGTQYTVRAISTDAESTGDVVAATLIEQTFPRGTVPLDAHIESSRPLRGGECVDVSFVGNDNFFAPGDPYYFTLNW